LLAYGALEEFLVKGLCSVLCRGACVRCAVSNAPASAARCAPAPLTVTVTTASQSPHRHPRLINHDSLWPPVFHQCLQRLCHTEAHSSQAWRGQLGHVRLDVQWAVTMLQTLRTVMKHRFTDGHGSLFVTRHRPDPSELDIVKYWNNSRNWSCN